MKKIIKIFVIIQILALYVSAQQTSLKQLLLNEMELNLRNNDDIMKSISTLNLQECLQRAISKSGKLNIAKHEYKLSLVNFLNSKRKFFPKADLKYEEIDGTTTGEDFRGKGYKFGMQYPLFSGLKTSRQFKQAKLNLEVSRIKHDQIKMNVLNEAEKAYYLLAEASLRNNFIQDLKKIVTDSEKTVKERLEQKLARDIDWLETKILSKEVDLKLIEAKNDYLLAELSLRQILDYYNGTLNIENIASFDQIEFDEQTILRIAIESRPDIKLHRLLERVNKYNKEIADSESNLQISLDSYIGRRAENFDSEKLDYDDEYYIGLTGFLPFGKNTIETQFIDQDSVPSAGQTTSTEFQSYSVKLKIFDNTHNSSQLEGLIKYYKTLEDSERIKKSAIFEVGKTIIELQKTYEQLIINQDKLSLAKKKNEIQKIKMENNEASITDYLKESIAFFDAQTNYTKSLSSYYTIISDLNKVIGRPGYYKPAKDMQNIELFSDQINSDFKPENRYLLLFSNFKSKDPYYPRQSYEELKFKEEKKRSFMFWKNTRYIDPLSSVVKE